MTQFVSRMMWIVQTVVVAMGVQGHNDCLCPRSNVYVVRSLILDFKLMANYDLNYISKL